MSINGITNFGQSELDTRKKLKRKILATSALGTSVALGVISHQQGFRISNLNKVAMKDWVLFKITPKSLQVEEKEIIALAGGSILGGLAGGAIFDKKSNFKAKLKEALNQMLGNVLIPVGCVGQTSRFYKKHETKILSKVPQIKKNGKFFELLNRGLKAIPAVALTGIALAVGIFTGNKVSNFINEK